MANSPVKKIQTGGNYADKMRSIVKPQAAMGSMGESPMMAKRMRKGGDVQSESSKLDQKNEAMDKAQEEGRKRYEKQEEEDNKAPRKAVGEAIDYVKEKASKFGKDFVEGAKLYGETYKKGLGMKSGGSVKSASARADGCAIRGKTRA